MFNHFNETSITLTYKPYKDNTKKRKKVQACVTYNNTYMYQKNSKNKLINKTNSTDVKKAIKHPHRGGFI